MLRTILELPRTVWLIGLISLINDSAGEMLYPIIPLYISSVLMSGPKILGLIEGITEAMSSLIKLLSGILSDRTGRNKPWIILGYSLAGLGRPLIAFVTLWPWLLVLRILDRVGKGLRSSPRDSLLAHSVSPDIRGLAFGFHRAMDNAGSVLGPLLAYVLLSYHTPLPTIFLYAAFPALICILLTFAIQDTVQPIDDQANTFDWKLHEMPAAFRRYLWVVALFTLGNASNMFLLLHAKNTGVAEANIPLLWAAVSTVAMLFSTPFSALSDTLGRTRLLTLGYLAYGIFYLSMIFIPHQDIWVMTLFGFYGLFMAATEGVEKALVADLAPNNRRGTAFGWFNLIAGAFLLPASLIFGELYEMLTPDWAFGFSASCALISAILMQFWVKPEA